MIFKQKHLIFLFKGFSLLGMLFIFYDRIWLNDELHLDQLYQSLSTLISHHFIWIILILLTLLNWFFDNLIWHITIQAFHKKSFLSVLENNLISQSFGILLPFGIGDYGGRTQMFLPNQKKSSLILSFSYRISKAAPKWILGFIVAFFVLKTHHTAASYILLSLSLIILLWMVFYHKRFLRYLFSLSFFSSNQSLSEVDLEKLHFSKVFFPALLKFMSYCLQFALIVNLIQGIQMTDALSGSILLYSISSILPQAGLLDPVIKTSLTSLINPLQLNMGITLMATTFVWMLNVGIPGIIGILLWIFKKPQGQ